MRLHIVGESERDKSHEAEMNHPNGKEPSRVCQTNADRESRRKPQKGATRKHRIEVSGIAKAREGRRHNTDSEDDKAQEGLPYAEVQRQMKPETDARNLKLTRVQKPRVRRCN